MRLLFLLRQLNTGGAQRQVVELIRSLDPASFQITVLTFYPGGQFESAVAGTPNVQLMSIGKTHRWDTAAFLWRLVRAVRAAKPDVIHSYLVFPNLLAVMLGIALRVKVVWGIRQSNKDVRHLPWSERVAFAIEKLLSRFPDLIVFNSEAGLQHYVANGFPRATSIVIPNGIDTTRFRPGADGAAIRRSWSIAAGEIVFGVVGRIDPTKDQLNFVRAAALIHERLPEARFVVIGPEAEPYATTVRSEVRRLALQDVVVFTGGIDVDATTYAALDVFVSCSPSEGFPNAVAEALACGRRCVVTDAGDSAAIVGSRGLIVPPKDPDALARAMLQAVDLDVDVSDAARSIEHRYGTELLARRTGEALLRLRS